MRYRVRLKGTNFIAHVDGAPTGPVDVLAPENAVTPEALKPGKTTTPRPATWLLVDAKDPAEAERLYRLALDMGKAKPAAPFIVEKA